ncbi:MAG: glutathione-disulfide reductase [Rhodospirillaceae bacterium]|jgi:glutathione reductase (NADPH)|nr:glutathione-disulfide reductase [Rhodospirillaceae bacterium]|tara:strand:- start:3426 stop:4814 length:1389 start_codon:yes stop_codon:yes gene_type:complete
MNKYDYDLIAIGAGSGGVRASRRAAALGKRVAIVENLRTGGTCVMRGCVPKKLLVYASHFADDFEDSSGYGWQGADPGFDWPALIEAKNKELDRLEAIYHRILSEAGVEEIFATATVADPHTVEVDGSGGKSLTTETILVATGGWPKMPPIPGIEHVITSNEALDLARLPERIAIVGGGYVAVEFAGIFNSLGARVTEIIRAPQILRGFDDDVRGALAGEMENKGIDIRSETEVGEITKDGNAFSLKLKGGGTIAADLVMYATGRAPNTRGMGLEEAGVALDGKGAVKVDEYSRSSVGNIYAIGDVTERMNLTPVAIAEAEAMVKTAFEDTPTAVDYAGVPSAVFSQPPIGTVGLTEAEAGAVNEIGGGAIDVYVSRFTPMKYTLSGRGEKSMMKLIVERHTDRVLGCHMVGLDAPEIIQGFAVALRTGATKAQFDATIGIHPTAAGEFFTLREKRPEPGEG